MISMKIFNAGTVITELRHDAERVVDTARGSMRRAAARIVKEAKLNTPVDKFNLEESIHIERSTEEGSGRLQLDVVAGGVVHGVNVDEYALGVHENYDEEHPGEGTIEKRAANPGRHVGGHFLSRAAEAEEIGLAQRMISDITKVIEK